MLLEDIFRKVFVYFLAIGFTWGAVLICRPDIDHHMINFIGFVVGTIANLSDLARSE